MSSTLSRQSTRTSIAQDSSVPVAVASALFAAGVTWALKPSRTRTRETIIPNELVGVPYSKELELAVEAALKAGENIMSHSESKGTAEEVEKSSGDELQVDEKNERIVIEAVRALYPDHKIIGEPTEQGIVPELTPAPTWVIDPVDGTTNFDSGLPLTCVSIGFCVEGKPVMGVVYAPITNELYMGVRGYGSYRNGVRITGCRSKETKRLSEAVVNFEFGQSRSDVAKCVRNIMKNGVRTTRCLGSGVLDFCYVATGRLDVVYAGVNSEEWKPWDYCAAYVIVREAGGAMESLLDQKPGDELNLYGSMIVCATSRELLEETRRVALGDF